MLPESELLQYIYKTTDMGCKGIQSVLDRVKDTSLKTALEGQYQEYETLRTEAYDLLRSHDIDAKGVSPVAKASSEIMSSGKLLFDDSASKIAEMTIQGNNMGITKTIKHLHDYGGKDDSVKSLAKKLLSTEEANVKQMEQFL